MKMQSQFTVPSAPERVFPLFLDPAVMRTCIPGCEELERVDDKTFRGRLVNVVAHVRFNATFSAHLESIEEPRQVKALLKGEDNRLASSIKVDALLGVQPDPAGSLVGYEMELALWGKLGRLGESVVRRRTAEVEDHFVKYFSAAATGTPIETLATTGLPQEPSTPDGAAARPRSWWQRLRAWFRARRRRGA
ncbi:MAG: CoxG family protein [Nocardioidaceae bacterium]